MKKAEYIEGPEARENSERGIIALFKAPKEAIGKVRKKGRTLIAPKKKRGKEQNGMGVSRVPASWRGDWSFPVSSAPANLILLSAYGTLVMHIWQAHNERTSLSPATCCGKSMPWSAPEDAPLSCWKPPARKSSDGNCSTFWIAKIRRGQPTTILNWPTEPPLG